MRVRSIVAALLTIVFVAPSVAGQEPAFVLEWGSFGAENGQFDTPFDITVTVDGSVFVLDTNNDRVQKFDGNGNFLLKWGVSGVIGEGRFNAPAAIAADPQGNIYVADTENHRIQRFDASGNFLGEWGSVCNLSTGAGCQADGSGQFNKPFGIASSTNAVFVADTNNDRIQRFSGSGTYILQWGSAGHLPGEFGSPYGLAIGPAGDVYVADRSRHRVQRFTGDGTVVTTWGTQGSAEGQFQSPVGLAVDDHGNLFVTDLNNHRVQVFDADGVFIIAWGSAGTGQAEFVGPRGIAVDANGVIYVADTENHRIQKFDSPSTAIESQSWGRTKGQYR